MSLSIRGFLYALPYAAILGLLGACSTTQLTSGTDYVSRAAPLSQFRASADTDLNTDIQNIANIEPDLKFPARIGLAKIDKHKLQAISLADLDIWQTARDNLPFAAGDFVPLSPLITASVSVPNDKRGTAAQNLLANIRRGSARQHLDYVLIYDVTHYDIKKRNALSIADVSILGLFALPSRDVKVESSASAILMDVRSGYPYGTASAFKEAARLSTSHRADSAQTALEASNTYDVTQILSQDVVDMLIKLNDESQASFDEQ